MSIQSQVNNVRAELGQVRKESRVKLARLRALRKSADALVGIQQTKSVGNAVLTMTAKEAKTVKDTVDLQDKLAVASAKIADKGAKQALENGKASFVIVQCDSTGAPLLDTDEIRMEPADGRAVWTLLSGAKGFMVAEQVDMFDERTEGVLSGMNPGDVLKVVKTTGDKEWEKLIRCGGIMTDGEEDGRYWEVIRPADTRTVNREFVRSADTAVDTAAAGVTA